MSPIEQKLQKCGPCGGIPPYPRFIQEKLEAELLGKPDKDKDAKKDKDGKKDKKGAPAAPLQSLQDADRQHSADPPAGLQWSGHSVHLSLQQSLLPQSQVPGALLRTLWSLSSASLLRLVSPSSRLWATMSASLRSLWSVRSL